MSCLYFRTIPDNYREGEEVRFIGFEFSGIQKYIFNVQNQKGSLKQIKQNSRMIEQLTDAIMEYLDAVYPIDEEAIVTKTSGKLYYILKNDVDMDPLRKKLKALQRDVYLSFKGQLRLYYADINAILKSEKAPDEEPAYKVLTETMAHSRRHNYALLDVDNDKAYTNLNKPVELEKTFTIDKLIEPEQKHRYITGVKLDFDDLGRFFANLGYSDAIESQGSEMAQRIEHVLDAFPDVYQVFVGGDDLFLLMNYYEAFETTLQIKKRLEKAFEDLDYPFGISAGMVHFKEKTSIIYYGEQLEEELDHAKFSGKNRISLENTAFTWESFESVLRYQKDLYEKRKKKSFTSSTLYNIETTVQSIIMDDKPLEARVRDFILKIPLIESKIEGLIPKALLSLNTNDYESYFETLKQYYFGLKYANRWIEKKG